MSLADGQVPDGFPEARHSVAVGLRSTHRLQARARPPALLPVSSLLPPLLLPPCPLSLLSLCRTHRLQARPRPLASAPSGFARLLTSATTVAWHHTTKSLVACRATSVGRRSTSAPGRSPTPPGGGSSRRRGRHSADPHSTRLLRRLPKAEGCSKITVSLAAKADRPPGGPGDRPLPAGVPEAAGEAAILLHPWPF